MPKQIIFQSDRLLFRLWENEDNNIFSQMNSNKDVMKYFPTTLSHSQSNVFVQSIKEKLTANKFGLWAVETKLENEFIGYIGFNRPNFNSFFTPCIEIGWRLAKKAWGNGYATEGAKRCLSYGFKDLGLNEIYSFTTVQNIKSVNVMQKIGLKKAGVFLHPNLDNLSQLKKHVLYKITKEQFNNEK